jgi:hypothetical protein
MNSQGSIGEVRVSPPSEEISAGVRWIADQIIREFTAHQKALDERLKKVEDRLGELSDQIGEADKKLDEVNTRCENRGTTCAVMSAKISEHQAFMDYTRGKGAVISIAVPVFLVAVWEVVKGAWGVVMSHKGGP